MIMVVNICLSRPQLTIGWSDLSQAEKKITAVKDEQIHKMTIIFLQNGQKLSFWVNVVVILWICSSLTTVIFFSAWDKSRDSSANSSELEQVEWIYAHP